MGVAQRREREKKALRREILSAARELFAKEGYESVSMRRIAEKIEYSPTTIYLYFHDKRELISEICDEAFKLMLKRLERATGASEDPVASLKAGLRAYVDFGVQHPEHYRVALMTPHEEKDKPIEDSEGWTAFQSLIQGVGRCVEAGRFREEDVLAASQVLWTTVHGVTSLLITHGDCFPWVDKDRLIDLTIDNAVRGMLR
jgi:AcrR family transcriptional regulator